MNQQVTQYRASEGGTFDILLLFFSLMPLIALMMITTMLKSIVEAVAPAPAKEKEKR